MLCMAGVADIFWAVLCSTPDGVLNHLCIQVLCCVVQLGLKCADVGHLAARWDVHERWVACLEEELFLQGDQERLMHVNVSPLMDRHKNGITKSQASR